jgi:carboxyl-terminal processing protease
MKKMTQQDNTQPFSTALFFTFVLFLCLFSFHLNAEQTPAVSLEKTATNSLGKTETTSTAITPRTLNQILRQIDSYYVDEVNVNVLLENAIKEVFKQLDPHSTYLNETDLNALFEMANGQYDGLGIEVELRNELLVVLSTINNSPAEMAGLQKGDIIRSINEVSIKGKNLEEVSQLIKKSGQKTQLVVNRDDYSQALDFVLEKAKIEVQSVSHKVLNNNIGYLKIFSFQSSTTDDMTKTIDSLKASTGDNLQGLIIDLRDNPGGVLDSAVGVSDLFLNKGTIVTTRGRFNDANHNFLATPGDVLLGKPIYVLINKGSASASEIVAGALKENGRATIVGMQSFGKGSVQSLIPLGNGNTAIKLTTALYFTPDGLSINGIGIKPDVEIPQQQVNNQQQSPIMGLDDRWAMSGKMLANRDFQLDEAEKLVLKHIRH